MNKFNHAYNGLKIAIKHRAVLIQFVLAILAIVGGIIIRLDYYEWLAFLICIGLVITSELLNTCIEMICNYLTIEYDERIKKIKDISSGAVLFSSIIALLVCIICTIRRFI